MKTLRWLATAAFIGGNALTTSGAAFAQDTADAPTPLSSAEAVDLVNRTLRLQAMTDQALQMVSADPFVQEYTYDCTPDQIALNTFLGGMDALLHNSNDGLLALPGLQNESGEPIQSPLTSQSEILIRNAGLAALCIQEAHDIYFANEQSIIADIHSVLNQSGLSSSRADARLIFNDQAYIYASLSMRLQDDMEVILPHFNAEMEKTLEALQNLPPVDQFRPQFP